MYVHTQVTITHSFKSTTSHITGGQMACLSFKLIAMATECNHHTADSLLQILQLRWPLTLTINISIILHYLVKPPDPVFASSLLFPPLLFLFACPISVYLSLSSLILTSFLPYSMFAPSFTICCRLEGCSSWPALMLLTRSYSQSVANHAKHSPRVYFPFQASTQGQIGLNSPMGRPMTKEKTLISETLSPLELHTRLTGSIFYIQLVKIKVHGW